MRRFGVILAFLAAFMLLIGLASAESVTVDGFTVVQNEDGNFITSVDDSVINDGVLLIPETLGEIQINGYEPSLLRDEIKLIICSVNCSIHANEDNAPEQTLRSRAFRRMPWTGCLKCRRVNMR